MVSRDYSESKIFGLSCIKSTCLFLIVLFLSGTGLAADIVVDNNYPEKTPQLTQTSMGIPQINIAAPINGFSYNQFKQFSVGADGVVINNAIRNYDLDECGKVKTNPNLAEPAKVIIFEITGADHSELLGINRIVGEQAKIILINQNGLIFNNCNIVNSSEVEFQTDGNVQVGNNGLTVGNGSLLLNSDKTAIEGNIYVHEDLIINSKSTSIKPSEIRAGNNLVIDGGEIQLDNGAKLKSDSGFIKIDGKKVTGSGDLDAKGDISVLSRPIEGEKGGVSLNLANASGDIFLGVENNNGNISASEIKANQNSNIKLFGEKIDVKNINGAENLIIGGEINNDPTNWNVKNIEMAGADYNVTASTTITGNLKFVGKSFTVPQYLKINGNFTLDLTGSFINNAADRGIIVDGNWNSVSKDFINQQKIKTGVFKANVFQSDQHAFVNRGIISADSIQIRADKAQNEAIFQESDGILESRNGKMELIAPEGGMYFGYKKEFTQTGDKQYGFKFIGSQLLSPNDQIHIQSGGNVVFDGTQTITKNGVMVEAKGQVTENIQSDNYQVIKDVPVEVYKRRQNGTTSIQVGKTWGQTDTKNIMTRGLFGIPDWNSEAVMGWIPIYQQVPNIETYSTMEMQPRAVQENVILKPTFTGGMQPAPQKADIVFEGKAAEKQHDAGYLKNAIEQHSLNLQSDYFKKGPAIEKFEERK